MKKIAFLLILLALAISAAEPASRSHLGQKINDHIVG
jgi:hypothetical protein